MPTYTQRVQTVLTEKQFRELERVAEDTGKPISLLVREAVETVYFAPQQEAKRLKALEELLSLDAPVADWDIMEDEIIRGALE